MDVGKKQNVDNDRYAAADLRKSYEEEETQAGRRSREEIDALDGGGELGGSCFSGKKEGNLNRYEGLGKTFHLCTEVQSHK